MLGNRQIFINNSIQSLLLLDLVDPFGEKKDQHQREEKTTHNGGELSRCHRFTINLDFLASHGLEGTSMDVYTLIRGIKVAGKSLFA